MGVCLEICLGYKHDNIFRCDTTFDLDKELYPIYDELFELEQNSEIIEKISFNHSEKYKKETPYGDKIHITTIGKFLDILTNIYSIEKLSKIEQVYSNKGHYDYSRWNDNRIKGIVAYLQLQDKKQNLVMWWT